MYPKPAFLPRAGSADPDDFSGSACVSVWWGAEPSFEDSLLRDLSALDSSRTSGSSIRERASSALAKRRRLSRQQQLDRLAVPKATLTWQPGPRSELGTRSELGHDGLTRDEISLDATADARSRVLDQLAFSQALQRHMKLLLLEDEMERILAAVKRTVRQGLGGGVTVLALRLLPHSLGGVDSGARTLQR